jgi:hypothetical protein
MPEWLKNQLQKAFSTKNIGQIKLLNDSWAFYCSNQKK